MSAHFIGTCVHLETEDIHAYDDTEKEITRRTFAKHLGAELYREVNTWFGVRLSQDWHVSYGKGTFQGKPVVVLHHSHIHHFFQTA